MVLIALLSVELLKVGLRGLLYNEPVPCGPTCMVVDGGGLRQLRHGRQQRVHGLLPLPLPLPPRRPQRHRAHLPAHGVHHQLVDRYNIQRIYKQVLKSVTLVCITMCGCGVCTHDGRRPPGAGSRWRSGTGCRSRTPAGTAASTPSVAARTRRAPPPAPTHRTRAGIARPLHAHAHMYTMSQKRVLTDDHKLFIIELFISVFDDSEKII